MTTSAPNNSLNSSDILMDLSIKNFWIIVHYPCSDPDSEYEIVRKEDLVFESWEVLERGVAVTVKYGNAKVQGVVVAVSDDYEGLTANFEDYIQEFKEMRFENKRNFYSNKSESPKPVRCVIKIADKETQTEPEQKNAEYVTMKRQYEELQNKYNNLKASLTEIENDLQNTMLKIGTISNTTTKPKPPQKLPLQPTNSENKDCKEYTKGMVEIGSGGTKIPRHVYLSLKWTNYSAATRRLLITLFPRTVLATHSLTGKPSPAFIATNKKTKRQLDAIIISDIIEIIVRKCGVSESLVRNAITTKCADENKMYKKRLEKGDNDENEGKRARMEL